MSYQVIWEKFDGDLIGELPVVVQGSTLETITILALYRDGSGVDLSGMTVTATMTDRAGTTYGMTGSFAGADGSLAWTPSAGDVGTAGSFSVIVTYSDGSDVWRSDPVQLVVVANPAATAVQNDALVGVTSAEAAWVTAGKTAVPDAADLVDANDLGSAAYAATGDFDAAGSAAAAQAAAQTYADGLNTAMDGRVDILEAALIPFAVADLAATANGSAAIDLAWTYTAVAPITGFKIYRKTGAGAYSLIDTAADDATSYADSGLSASTEYTYRVDAYNTFFQAAGNEDSATTEDVTLGELILALPGIKAYWPLTEASGVTADNATGDAGLDGTYVNSPALATTAFPVGSPAPLFNQSNDCVDIYNNDYPTDFDGANGWLMIWFKDPSAGGGSGNIFYTYVDSNNRLYLDSISAWIHYFTMRSGGGNLYYGTAGSGSRWHMVVLSWGTGGNKGWCDGKPIPMWSATKNTWVGSLTNLTAIGATGISGSGSYNGSIAHVAFGAGGSTPSDAEILAIWNKVYPTTYDIVFCGDSKTHQDIWPAITTAKLSDAAAQTWRQPYYGLSDPGDTVAQLHANIDANVSNVPTTAQTACINIGVNDAASPPAEATWKADLVGCIDGLRGRCPNIQIYISRVWMASQPANCAIINGWIDDVIALYAYVHAGPDESVWLENGDNGATYTTDGTHYSAAGQIEAANQWVTALGY